MKIVSQLICLSLLSNGAFGADVLHYVLLPGSTITALSNGTAVGSAEPLSGSFDWVQFDTASSILGFDATNLDFRSESFGLQLNTTTNNDVGTSVFPNSCMTYFEEVVNLSGLSAATGQINSFDAGCYAGPPGEPISLNYPSLGISPLRGGFRLAKLSLYAALDSDRDGVPDSVDECLGTSNGDIVDAHGCSIEQLVPCEGPVSGGRWKNHGQYISTLIAVAHQFLDAGRITPDQLEALIQSRAEAECGAK